MIRDQYEAIEWVSQIRPEAILENSTSRCGYCNSIECVCITCSICGLPIRGCTCFCQICGQMKCCCHEMDCMFCGTELMMNWPVLDDNGDLIEIRNKCPNLRCNKDKSTYKPSVLGR